METLHRERYPDDARPAKLEGSSFWRDRPLEQGIESRVRKKKPFIALSVRALGSPLSRSHP
jgi:hypothetical protein